MAETLVIEKKMLNEIFFTLRHARVFITSRLKMNPVGVELYDELFSDIEALKNKENRREVRMEIKVIYNKNSQIDPDLDDQITKAMKGIGFSFYASGCNRINGERDVTFRDGN